ncbi:MAG: hypothetical protein Q9190_007876, partial [Brigantiaea leucoxantha]
MRVYSLDGSEEQASPLITVSLLRTLKPHTTPVITAAVDGRGTLFATGGADGVIKIWDIRGGYVTHTFRGHSGVISALLFFEAADPNLEHQRHTKDQRKRGRSDENVPVDKENTQIKGEASRFRLASGSEDGKIRIWDLLKRKTIAILDSHVSVIRGLCFTPTQSAVVSASRDKTAIIWDALTWKVRNVIPVLEGVESVGLLAEDSLIFTGGETGRLRLWEARSGREVTDEQPAGGEGDNITQIIHNPRFNFLLCVHGDQSLVLRSTSPLSNPVPPESTIEPPPTLCRISGTYDEIIDLTYLTRSQSLMALATNSENIRLISLASGSSDSTSPGTLNYFGADVALLEGHEDIVICLDVDWSGCWLATGAKDNTARLWRIDHANNSYEQYATYTGHAESLGAISLPSQSPPAGSPAQTDPLSHPPAFVITGSQDSTVKKWNVPKVHKSKQDTNSSRAVYTRKAHDKDINAISINHNSTLFASASQDRTVKIWSTEEGEVQGILRGHRRGVWSVQFAPKDTPNISGDNGPASASRGLVLTGSGDKSIKIWSLTDYSCLRTFEGHSNSVLKVLWLPPPFSPDSTPLTSQRPTRIASAGGDGLVKIWDANTGETACTLDNHSDRIWALTLNSDSSTLVSGGGDGVITFWQDTTSDTLAATAAASTARIEQEQQLTNHIHSANYREAIILALSLNHPARLLNLFQNVVDASSSPEEEEEGSLSGIRGVDDVLASLADEQLLELMKRIRDWNTNARTAAVAQRILNVI